MAEATELDRVFHVLLQNRGLKGPGELGNAKVILVLVRQLLGSYDPVITYTRPTTHTTYHRHITLQLRYLARLGLRPTCERLPVVAIAYSSQQPRLSRLAGHVSKIYITQPVSVPYHTT